MTSSDITTERINWYTWQSSVSTRSRDNGATTWWFFNAFTRSGSVKRAEAFFEEYNDV